MNTCIATLAGVLMATIAWVQPAAAQGLPQGSYLRSCNGAALHGDALVATCRRADGREQRTSLADVRRCVGDIGNNNGNLQCSYGGGHAGPASGYGERRYGEPGYGGEMRERCIGLHREAENLRIRMDREWNPLERSRTEGRLREVQEQEARAGCRR
jgi:CVNH domain